VVPGHHGSSNFAVPYANIKDITITIHQKDGAAVESVLSRDVDAVFFTVSAIDKFVIPYYARVYNAQFAADIRAAYVRNLRALRK